MFGWKKIIIVFFPLYLIVCGHYPGKDFFKSFILNDVFNKIHLYSIWDYRESIPFLWAQGSKVLKIETPIY